VIFCASLRLPMLCRHPVVNPKTLSQLPEYVGISDYVLRGFLAVSSAPNTVWLLGAGSSHPVRPMRARLQTDMVEACLGLGGWPAVMPTITDFRCNLMRNSITETRLDSWKLAHTPEDFLRVRYETVLLGSETAIQPRAQFQFFGRIPRAAVILTTNQDSLLHHFASNVLCLHGCVYENFWHLPGVDKMRAGAIMLRDVRYEAASEWDIDPGPTPWLHLPGDASSPELVRRIEVASRCIVSCTALVVIGYSFSDQHIFEMLGDTTRARLTCPLIIVIGPEANEQSALLGDAFKSKCVWPMQVGWEVLAKAIVRISFRYLTPTLEILLAHAQEIYLELQSEMGMDLC